MQEGAFALMDCLGFRGIWKRTDQTLLLKKLKSILQRIHPQLIAGLPFHLLRRTFIITPSLLSDSVAISLRYADETSKQETKKIRDRREKSYLVWLLCASTIKVLDLYLNGEPSLVLRGCITYGQYEHDTTETGSFIVGPAVDDAANFSNISQGAFVWLHPDAAALYRYAVEVQQETVKILYRNDNNPELLEGSKKSLREPLLVDKYDVPLKEEGGGPLRCAVINPLAFHDSEEERQAVFRAYKKAMSGNNKLDVMLKRQHTLDFLERANEARREHLRRYDEFIKSVEES
ncbi:MAG TPA: hypothetical protein VF546_24810 [Pyrinomonadaceae bacterium]|jgi:hypothetical protein